MPMSLSDFEARKRRYQKQREDVRRKAAMVAAASNATATRTAKSAASSAAARESAAGSAAAARRSGAKASHAGGMDVAGVAKPTPVPTLPPQLRLRRNATASKSFLERMLDRHATDLSPHIDDEVSRRPSFESMRPHSSHSSCSSSSSKPGFTSARNIARAGSAANEDSSALVASMATRLSDLEHKRKELTRKVVDLETQVAQLTRENHRLRHEDMVELAHNQQLEDDGQRTPASELEALRLENVEMKRFLRDYGMEWRGGDVAENVVDFDRLLRALEELNALAGPSGVIQRGNNTRIFGLSDCRTTLDLLVFKNGILTGDGAFRSFEDPRGRAFVHDVEDGYFPSEFKASHPAGVAFAIQDRRGETHDPSTCKLIAGQSGVRRLGAAEVAQQVPKYVIRDGEIVRPREALERFLGGDKNDDTPTSSPAQPGRGLGPLTSKEPKTICSLQEPLNVTLLVHFTADSRSQTCIIKLNAEETVADACQLLCCSATKLKFGTFVLRSAMPGERGRDFACRSTTSMRDAGWAPNAVLYVKAN